MLIDGIQLAEGSDVTNLTVAMGEIFPNNASNGEFFLKSDAGVYNLYIYHSGSWNRVADEQSIQDTLGFTPVNKAGDTMTGALTLSGAPTQPLHAVTKSYVDSLGGGTGSVTQVSFTNANGFTGTVATSTTTPNLTLGTSITGILKGDGTSISAAVAADFPTLNQSTTGSAAAATNILGGQAGNVMYQTGANATAFIANGTVGQVLTSNGSAAPSWQTFSGGITVTNDSANGNLVYPLWTTSTSGSAPTYVSTDKISFVPSAGRLSAVTFNGTNVITQSISSALTAATGSTAATPINITANAAVNGTSGAVNINGGNTSGTSTAGAVNITGGQATGTSQNGGKVVITGGMGAGSGANVEIYGGSSSTGLSGSGNGIVLIQGSASVQAGATQLPGYISILGGFTNQPGVAAGGSVYLEGGQHAGSTGVGGNAVIRGGVGGASGQGGAIIFSTAPSNSLIERFRIIRTGAWSVGNSGTDTGTLGQVLTSNGAVLSPSWTSSPSLNLSASTADGTNAVGFRHIPQNPRTADYTLVLDDAGKHIFHPATDAAARTITIPSNASVAFPIGTAITFINQHSSPDMTIAINSDTMRLAGAGTTGNRTLAANGVATAIKVTATTWIISGTNLT